MNGGLDATIVVDRPSGFGLDVSLHIGPGETAALVGPNGAGKSTTVGALAGLTPLSGGRIELAGRVLADGASASVPPEERHIGLVPQDHLLFPHLDVTANIAFGLRARGMRRADADAVARSWLDRVGLDGRGGRLPGELSGGQSQRVALARALAGDPDLLLLDEPLAALDVESRTSVRRLLETHLAEFAGPRLLITHDPDEAFLLADTVHVIENGVITQVGTPDEIRMRPSTAYAARLGGTNLFRGVASHGEVDIGGHRLSVADHAVGGEVVVAIRPAAVAIHLDRPEGSPRNAWHTVIRRVERFGDRCRVEVEEPLALVAEVTPESVDALRLAPGGRVWVSVKATEIGVQPDA